jgi:hypothetical protein
MEKTKLKFNSFSIEIIETSAGVLKGGFSTVFSGGAAREDLSQTPINNVPGCGGTNKNCVACGHPSTWPK